MPRIFRSTKITGTLREDLRTVMISGRFFVRMRNVSGNRCKENRNTHFVSNNFFFPSEYRAFYEVIYENIVQTDRPQIEIRRMRLTWWITKATETHPEHVIRFAFPLPQWLHERRLNIAFVRIQYCLCCSFLYTHQ